MSSKSAQGAASGGQVASGNAANKGTSMESAQQLLLSAVQQHLPHPDVVGVFLHGKRVQTPSGRPVPLPNRPASATASRSRGVSVGAEESIPRRQAAFESLSRSQPPSFLIDHVESWILSTQSALKRKTDRSDIVVVGTPEQVLKRLTPHELCMSWRSDVLRHAKSRQQYPFIAAAVPDVACRGPVDRLATLLHAVAQFRALVEAGRPPTIAVERCTASSRPDAAAGGPRGPRPQSPNRTAAAQHDELHADSADHLFGRTFVVAPGKLPAVDAVAGADYRSHHIVLAYGTHFYAITIADESGQPLPAHAIRKQIVEAVSHAAASPHSHPFLEKVPLLPHANIGDWAEAVERLEATCLANRLSLDTMNRALMSVTLQLPASTAPLPTPSQSHLQKPVMGVSLSHDADGESAIAAISWTGCTTQMAMDPCGTCVIRCHAVHVDVNTLLVFAEWISSAANSDPLLTSLPIPSFSAPLTAPHCAADAIGAEVPKDGTSNATVTAVKRVAPCHVRTTAAPNLKAAAGKASAAAASAAATSEGDVPIEETASIVNIPVSSLSGGGGSPATNGQVMTYLHPKPLPLWLPMKHQSFVEGVDLRQPLQLLHVQLRSDATEAMIVLAAVIACDRVLRLPEDDLAPLVRVAASRPANCPAETLVFGPPIQSLLHLHDLEKARTHVVSDHNNANAAAPSLAPSAIRDAVRAACAFVDAALVQISSASMSDVPSTSSSSQILTTRAPHVGRSSLQGSAVPRPPSASFLAGAAATPSAKRVSSASLLGPARMLSKAGFIPGRPTLRSKGECCAPADVTIALTPPTPLTSRDRSAGGVMWLLQSHVGGIGDARFSLSMYRNDDRDWVCSIVHRRHDRNVAEAFGASLSSAAGFLLHQAAVGSSS